MGELEDVARPFEAQGKHAVPLRKKGTMRIREVILREVRMKLIAPFETSTERTEERRIILTEVVTDERDWLGRMRGWRESFL